MLHLFESPAERSEHQIIHELRQSTPPPLV
jgi:hypothetical protein